MKTVEIEHWQENKGVLIMGYEVFHRLTTLKDRTDEDRNEGELLLKALVNPGT